MGTFGCQHPKEALGRGGGPEVPSARERGNKRPKPACAAVGWPRPSAAFPTRRKCGSARAGLRAAGMGEGETNQLHGKGVGGFPSTARLVCITHLPRAPLPFAKVLWDGGCVSTVELAPLNPPCPLQKEHRAPAMTSPLPKTPRSPCSEPSCPPCGWCQRSGAMRCRLPVCRAPRRSQPCSPSTQKPPSPQDPVGFCG